MEAHDSRRYVTYWVEPSEISDAAKRLIQQRDAITVAKTSSDFFIELEQSIMGLRTASRPHPLSVGVAVANAKRYITSGDRVALHDLIAGALNGVVEQVAMPALTSAGASDWNMAIASVDGVMSLPMALVATVSRWGGPFEDDFWVSRMMEMSAQPANGLTDLWNLSYYAATLMLYTAGVGMILGDRVQQLERLLRKLIPTQISDKPGPLCSELSAARSLSCLGSESSASRHVYDVIAPIYQDQLLISDESISSAFDRLELLMVLLGLFCDSDANIFVRYRSAGIIRRSGSFLSAVARPVAELDALRVNGVHPWIALGLFDGDQDRFEDALKGFNGAISARAMTPRNY